MKGMSVTQRAKAVKQPRGGYIPPRMMEKTEYDDGRMLGEESVSPSVIGLAVDYLTRMELTGDREKAFEISMYRATRPGREKEGRGYLDGITGLDPNLDRKCGSCVRACTCMRARARAEPVNLETIDTRRFQTWMRSVERADAPQFDAIGCVLRRKRAPIASKISMEMGSQLL